MQPTLAELPPELLAQIVTQIKTARTLSHLSLTCKRVHAFIENDGFRIFVQSRFPTVRVSRCHTQAASKDASHPIEDGPQEQNPSSFWRDAAHGLTTLSRNWDRKAFIASSIGPYPDIREEFRRQRTHIPPRKPAQSMGFVPVIDSYESWNGGDWSSRKEVVAWGAGAGLVMRVKIMGDKAKDTRQISRRKEMEGLDQHGHKYVWTTFHEKGASEGRDDIISLNLLSQDSLGDSEQMIVGRASGALAQIDLSSTTSQGQIVASYATAGRPVKSSATSLTVKPLLASCLSDSTIAIYPISPSNSEVAPIGEISAFSPGQSGRIWSSSFLRQDRLAVGLGPAHEPIHLYTIGRGEIIKKSIRTLRIAAGDDGASDQTPSTSKTGTSVYSLAPVSHTSLAGGAEGDVFLSGAYDGFTRLHDLRSPYSNIATFRDPVDTYSPIYSLLPIGRERFAAGSGRHSIMKIFDLRMPGGKLYHAADLDPCSDSRNRVTEQHHPKKRHVCCDYHYDSEYRRRGWNVFLSSDRNRNGRRRAPDSPVYSLSRPSQCSPTLFAGIESTVVQFDVVSIMDPNPDPIFKKELAKTEQDLKLKWDPKGHIACLPLYEHNDGPVDLIKQQEVKDTGNWPARNGVKGWDERFFQFRNRN